MAEIAHHPGSNRATRVVATLNRFYLLLQELELELHLLAVPSFLLQLLQLFFFSPLLHAPAATAPVSIIPSMAACTSFDVDFGIPNPFVCVFWIPGRNGDSPGKHTLCLPGVGWWNPLRTVL